MEIILLGVVLSLLPFAFYASRMHKSITEPAQIPYENRWSDDKYVEMIHRTRQLEKDNLGDFITKCECRYHRGPKPGNECETGGCGAVECDRVCSVLQKKPRTNNNAIVVAGQHRVETIKPRPAVEYNEFIVEGYLFKIDASLVPSYAHGEWNEQKQCGVFSWTHPATGRTMAMRALPQLDIEADNYSIYVDQHEKPIRTVKPRRVSDDLRGRPNHIIFTASGQKNVTEKQLRKIFTDAVVADRKRKARISSERVAK